MTIDWEIKYGYNDNPVLALLNPVHKLGRSLKKKQCLVDLWGLQSKYVPWNEEELVKETAASEPGIVEVVYKLRWTQQEAFSSVVSESKSS